YLDKLKTDSLERITCCKTYSQMKNETVNIISNLISTQISTKKNKHDAIMKKCIQYIDTNFKEDISLEYMAELFYFNASYFGSLFKSINGITFSQYLQKVRINKAKEYLKNTAIKVYELAFSVGYSDPKYFIRVFKNEVGFSPDEYRRIVLSKKNEDTL
ncbi:helix-turn-helix transcriptional regulator, partial [Ruminiclostridium cellobioparum]